MSRDLPLLLGKSGNKTIRWVALRGEHRSGKAVRPKLGGRTP